MVSEVSTRLICDHTYSPICNYYPIYCFSQVLEVHMLGHRKRILASLGDQRHSWHSNNRSSVSSINQDSDHSSPPPPQETQPKQDLVSQYLCFIITF